MMQPELTGRNAKDLAAGMGNLGSNPNQIEPGAPDRKSGALNDIKLSYEK